MKKSDKIKIDVVLYKKDMNDWSFVPKEFGKMQSFASFKDDAMKNRNEILSRAEKGMNVKITKIIDNYCNLEFEDGFQCGLPDKYLIKMK